MLSEVYRPWWSKNDEQNFIHIPHKYSCIFLKGVYNTVIYLEAQSS